MQKVGERTLLVEGASRTLGQRENKEGDQSISQESVILNENI